ncbi:ABC transporter ATP-binding protein [Mesorhizobium sp. KR1-2]|uniref:ABC transporter ATP-binding protein n=1 Tax=Mesorhizobium sp. KR1-2 TaxID=3156609 RepID=UPI0032B58637
MSSAMLEVKGLNVSFQTGDGAVHAVRDLSLTVAPGEIVGLVGESGSGKSVTMMSVVRLLDRRRTEIRAEKMVVDGRSLLELGRRDLESVRGPIVSYIFQDPLTALNPLLTVGRQITEGMRRHKGMSRSSARARAIDLLRRVGIPAPETRIDQLPHQMSGGMRQRVMIAIALAADPKLLIADEPTTALDVTVQAEIVKLVQSIQRERGMAMVWVTHDLALLAKLADRVVVMYAGRIVEDATAEQLYAQPSHPYAAGLLASTSRIDDPFTEQDPIPGTPPNPKIVSPGCSFAPRCSRAQPRCEAELPELHITDDGRRVACFNPIMRT